MVNGKPVTDNGFRFRTTCTYVRINTLLFRDAAILETLGCVSKCHSETLVKTPLFGHIGHGQYHHQIQRQRFGGYDVKDYVESLTRTSGVKLKRRPLPGR